MAYADGPDDNTVKRGAPPLDQCSLAAAVDIVGDRWSLLIIRSALYGVTRFDELHSSLGLPRTVLSKRLKSLVDDGVMRRRPYKEAGQRTRHQYVLTTKGVDLALPLMALMQWGEKHAARGQSNAGIYERGKPNAPALKVGLVSEDGRPVELRDAQLLAR
ncbi:helix-turn-helix domain-containing protein [Hyphococcus formosus]|uniref:winged helix-turn-helix transcriptional regulator n=1 Tax=Hyphococcus formosus TaxID=3143534 RepID=UPI00398A70F3